MNEHVPTVLGEMIVYQERNYTTAENSVSRFNKQIRSRYV